MQRLTLNKQTHTHAHYIESVCQGVIMGQPVKKLFFFPFPTGSPFSWV